MAIKSKQTVAKIHILLAGGGSGGPVAPLLAVAKYLQNENPSFKFLLVGTKLGPEKLMAKKVGVDFTFIPTAKLRRYFSLYNLVLPFVFLVSLYQAWKLLSKFEPHLIFGAGGFTQVPLIWMGWFKKIPVLIHQQDVSPSLSNSVCAPLANKISVTFEESIKDFPNTSGLFSGKRKTKVFWTGNPSWLTENPNQKQALKSFDLTDKFPTLLVIGGGGGATYFNKLIAKSLPELVKFVQIIHSTGPHKNILQKQSQYRPVEFITNMANAYAASDIVLARSGTSTITELSHFEKVSIIVPMPQTHQEANALLLWKSRAAIVLDQQSLSPDMLIKILRKLLFDNDKQKLLARNIQHLLPKRATEKVSTLILAILKEIYG